VLLRVMNGADVAREGRWLAMAAPLCA